MKMTSTKTTSNPTVQKPVGKPAARPATVKAGNTRLQIYRVRDGDRRRFTLAYYEAGRRRLKQFTTLDDAKQAGERIATRLESGDRTAASMRDADAKSYGLAMRDLAPLEIPLHLAIEEYVKARAILNGKGNLIEAATEFANRHRGEVTPRTVAEIVEELLADEAAEGASIRHIQTLRSHCRQFAGAFTGNVGSITAPTIDAWLKERCETLRTRKNYRTSIVTLFALAQRRGYLPQDIPTEAARVAAPKATRLAKERGEVGTFTPDELVMMLDGGTDEVQLYITLSAFAGIRSSELVKLEWKHVHSVKKLIEIPAAISKTGHKRFIPIQPNLSAWLNSIPAGKGLLFTSEKAADRAIEHGKGKVDEWHSNGLRHSYASYRMAVIQNAPQVAEEMGNSVQMIRANYLDAKMPEDGEAWFAIVPEVAANVRQFRKAG